MLRTQQDFDAFVQRVPRTQVSMTNPPPRNDDPILQHPSVDFSKNMVVVVLRAGGAGVPVVELSR